MLHKYFFYVTNRKNVSIWYIISVYIYAKTLNGRLIIMGHLLTNPQNSIWLTEKFFKGTSVNNVCGYVYIKDEVNFDVLKKSINELIKAIYRCVR